jgi:hypothetical protein
MLDISFAFRCLTARFEPFRPAALPDIARAVPEIAPWLVEVARAF